MRKALRLIEVRPRGIGSSEFAKLMWPDNTNWENLGTSGKDLRTGVGMELAGGAYLGRLAKKGHVQWSFRHRGWIITAYGRREMNGTVAQ